jgi:hypothetical protein
LHRLELDHLQRDFLFLRLHPQAGAAEHQHRPVDGHGGFQLGDALVGQPVVLLLEEGLEALGKLVVVELAGPVAAKLAVESLRQPRQHELHQVFAHDDPRGVSGRPCPSAGGGTPTLPSLLPGL